MGVARHLNFLSGSQVRKNLFTPAGSQGLKLQQLLTDVDLRAARQFPDLVDLLLQFDQGFLELEQMTTGHDSRRGGEGGTQAAAA